MNELLINPELLRSDRPAPRRRVPVLIQPLQDPRWSCFVQCHPDASVFHSEAWLRALWTTYGFEPGAYTTSSPDDELENALLFCRVQSPLTGNRLVSLPFSDHCAPLVSHSEDLSLLLAAAGAELRDRHLRYVEVRPTRSLPTSLAGSSSLHYRWHQIDLTPELADIAEGFHKNCITRAIRRAERNSFVYTSGNSEALLTHFWKLYLVTRRRHQAPPQPIRWFRNLLQEFGERAAIRVASAEGIPVAAIFTLQHRDTLVYKYGCSDPRSQHMGGTHLLLWRAIQEAKEQGLRSFDLGRSDLSNAGLITFKDRWGAVSSDLAYSRFTAESRSRSDYHADHASLPSRIARRIVSYLPDRLFAAIGSLLYRHIG